MCNLSFQKCKISLSVKVIIGVVICVVVALALVVGSLLHFNFGKANWYKKKLQ